jgi:hypothetical protein
MTGTAPTLFLHRKGAKAEKTRLKKISMQIFFHRECVLCGGETANTANVASSLVSKTQKKIEASLSFSVSVANVPPRQPRASTRFAWWREVCSLEKEDR